MVQGLGGFAAVNMISGGSDNKGVPGLESWECGKP